MAKFKCPECDQRELIEHCLNCNWLYCGQCNTLFGPNNSVFIGDIKKKKKRNGV